MSNQPTVYVVDDDDGARNTTGRLLANSGYEVLLFPSGVDLMATIDQSPPPDVVVLDVMMPQMDGYTVCRQLRANPRYAHVPVILLTALDSRSELLRGLDVGADEFLTKPVHSSELRARVRSMLRIKGQYDQIARSLRVREELSSMIVEGMQMPLERMVGTLEMLLNDPGLTDGQSDLLHNLLADTGRLGGSASDALALVRASGGELEPDAEHFDARDVLDAVARTIGEQADARDTALHVRVPDQPVSLCGDRFLLVKAVCQMASRTLADTREGGRLDVRLGRTSVEGQPPMIRFETLGAPPVDESANAGSAFVEMVASVHDGSVRGFHTGQATGSYLLIPA